MFKKRFLRSVLLMVMVGVLTTIASTLFAAPQATWNIATSGSTFTPSPITIEIGDTVSWTNNGGFHNVKFVENGTTFNNTPSSTNWTFNHTFTTAGIYEYYCEIHGFPGARGGMSGTVTVSVGPTAVKLSTAQTTNGHSIPIMLLLLIAVTIGMGRFIPSRNDPNA